MTGVGEWQASCCAALVDEWVRGGVTDAVVAPGSRSTPLVLALDDDPRLRVHVVLDERVAGFVALGLGLRTGRPAVVATTSGTASVELHPAVAEASYAGVPLIAATSDRPPELHGVGAPQTLDQEGLFGSAPRWAVSLGGADFGGAASWRSIASRCVAVASGRAGSPAGGPGPVHLNVWFREPLLGEPTAIPPGRDGGEPWHRVMGGDSAVVSAGVWSGHVGRLPGDVVEVLRAHAGGRGVVMAGGGAAADPAAAAALVAAASSLGWPVLADPRSGCRLPVPGVIGAADALLRLSGVAGWRPDLVVRVGAPWASKVLNQWLAGLGSTATQVLVDPWGQWADPDRLVDSVVVADPAAVTAAMVAIAGSGSGSSVGPGSASSGRPAGWWDRWVAAEAAAQEAITGLLGPGGELGYSEPAVARATAAAVGLLEDGALVVSSSMPVRDVEWYGPPVAEGRVLSNRGVNGIDGVVSTALGVALAGQPTVALLGDLAFLYDASALVGASRRRDVALTVLVVDNDGGGIFSFLPQASALTPERFERYWGTPHGLDLAAVAAAYGAEVVPVPDRSALDGLLASASEPGVRVGVVRSERAANVAAHDRIHRVVAAALESGRRP
jgi:2-succinyl-5-enolpyruvyl-6-hydroxy-3-cyclohexene-1-carboxylate synthase